MRFYFFLFILFYSFLTPFSWAEQETRLSLFKKILTEKNKNGKIAMHFTLDCGYLQAARLSMQTSHAFMTEEDQIRQAPLFSIVVKPHHLEIIKKFIQKNRKLVTKKKQIYGISFHWILKVHYLEVIKLCIGNQS